jgi:hypothetical protein
MPSLSAGDFADIQVRNCLEPDDFLVVALIVFGHALARMPCSFLPVLSGLPAERSMM